MDKEMTLLKLARVIKHAFESGKKGGKWEDYEMVVAIDSDYERICEALRKAAILDELIELRAMATRGPYSIRGDLDGDFFIEAPRVNENCSYNIEVMSDDFYDDEDGEDLPYTRSQRIGHAKAITEIMNRLEELK